MGLHRMVGRVEQLASRQGTPTLLPYRALRLTRLVALLDQAELKVPVVMLLWVAEYY